MSRRVRVHESHTTEHSYRVFGTNLQALRALVAASAGFADDCPVLTYQIGDEIRLTVMEVRLS